MPKASRIGLQAIILSSMLSPDPFYKITTFPFYTYTFWSYVKKAMQSFVFTVFPAPDSPEMQIAYFLLVILRSLYVVAAMA